MTRFSVYHNTPENDKRFGWSKLPEQCDGDKSSPFVIHDWGRGKFIFVRQEIWRKRADKSQRRLEASNGQ